MSKKGKIILFVITVISVLLMSAFIIFFIDNSNNRCISVARASKMLALLESDKTTINSYSDGNDDRWYYKYMNYCQKNGLTEKDKIKKIYNRAYTYGDLRFYLNSKKISIKDVEEATDINPEKHKDREYISDADFKRVYDYFIVKSGNGNVHTEEITILGTNDTLEGVGKWQLHTNKGIYYAEGINMDKYVDTLIQVYVRDKEILSVSIKISDEIVYENVYFEKGEGNTITAYVGKTRRVFNVGSLDKNFSSCVGDIKMNKGVVTSVVLKQDTINGKVLMIDGDKVELENYGVLYLDDNFHVYTTYGIIEETDIENILVGYNITDFVIAGKKVCAAVISEPMVADNIRVMVMTTGFTSLFHERVSVKATGDYIVKYGDVEEVHKGTEIVDIYPESGYLSMGRISITTVNKEDKITILNVNKSYGNPSYRGDIEIALYDEGLVIINEVPIEEYLYAVVPSEMPVRFGVEALKVQAVCARSYAYKQLMNNSYGKYGAHVDDSVNFQVYNNVEEKDDSIRAVKETYGQVEAFNGKPITTYYYSTSCGHTSDMSVWGGDNSGTPYLTSKKVNNSGEKTDLSDEENFRKYINSINENDYDYGFGYYRWKINISSDDLSISINENLYGRYCASPGNIFVKKNDTWVSEEVRNIGKLEEIRVVKRTSGGAISEIVLKGTDAEILVKNELNIRYLLCPRNNPITLLKGDTTTFYILPSSYCIFDKTENGYLITGGGYGHGIGMSQNAVSNMVQTGMTYDEILKFFYEGSEIINVYE